MVHKVHAARPDRGLIKTVRAQLERDADPAKAGPMRAYMKSELPFRGVQSPGVKRTCREVFREHPIHDRGVWEETVRALFDEAEYREERYAAVALTGHRAYASWQDLEALALYDHLVVTGAWWDFVDEIAARRIGPILLTHPEQVQPVLLLWARDTNVWRRRTAILAQLKAKALTDTALLESCIRPSLGETGFFLRKAIGWALREYSRTDPDWVRGFVERHRAGLSALSVREALKHV